MRGLFSRILTKRVIFVCLLIALASAGIILIGVKNKPLSSQPRVEVRFATPLLQSSALVFLAEQLGYFRDEGLAVGLEFRSTGRDCLALVTSGQADFAVVFETPIVHSVIEGHQIDILTELHRSERNTAVIARRDRGIQTAEDLVGKKVAIVPKTNAEFLLNLVLSARLIDSRSVTLLPMSVSEALEAVHNGTADAAALWEPHLSRALAEGPKEFNVLRTSFYSEFSTVSALHQRMQNRPDLAFSVLRALKRAEFFYEANAREAQAIVDRFLSKHGGYVSKDPWQHIDIHLGLSATLLAMLREEARWAGASIGATRSPDMRLLLLNPYLEAVFPSRVTFR